MRILNVSLFVIVLSASGAHAATFSSKYDAFASASVSLLSATFEESGADARASISNNVWQDGGDYATFATGGGSYDGGHSGDLWGQGVSTYSHENKAWGYADSTETYAFSHASGWITPTFNYSHECSGNSLIDCSGTERVVLELSYSLQTTEWTEGNASATAEAFLGAEYFSNEYDVPWRPEAGWDFEITASGSETLHGTFQMTMDAGSALGFFLYSEASGTAEYTPELHAVPVPGSIPLLASGLVLMGLMFRRQIGKN